MFGTCGIKHGSEKVGQGSLILNFLWIFLAWIISMKNIVDFFCTSQSVLMLPSSQLSANYFYPPPY